MRHSLLILLCVALLRLAACQRGQAPVTVTRLPSGQEIRVVQIGPMFFSAGKPALMVKYATKTSFDDVPALREEAKEIEKQLRSTLNSSGREWAIFRAQEPQRTQRNTVISESSNFIAKKQSDGTWKLKE